MLNGLDLFSGIGGIALALGEWVRPIAYCEVDPYAQAVLQTRFESGGLPAAPIWDDIRSLDGLPFRGLVDIIYGGFPCQDLSTAGLGKGLEGERSALFFEIMRLAKEIRPQFIFLENVPAIRKRGLAIVGHELANAGFDCRWSVTSAAEVGAPHIRKRWFLLGHAKSKRDQRKIRVLPGTNEAQSRSQVEHKNAADEFIDAIAEAGVLPNTHYSTIREQSRWGSRAGGKETFKPEFDGWWKTEPDVGRVVNGLPARVDRIKCLGNAVVPLQAKTAFERLIGV